jgi:chemotaxis response regulator CheB
MRKANFYIVGIGLSIGGIDPLCKILSSLPVQANAAFLIVQHLDPAHRSLLAERLRKSSSLKVVVATHQQVIENHVIYVLAEGQMMTIEGGSIILRKRRHDETVNKAVDILFKSMAFNLGSRAVSVILSGLDGDGSLGAEQVNLKGGITIAQLPATAQYPSMPESAISTGQTHFILSPVKIAELLTEIIKA